MASTTDQKESIFVSGATAFTVAAGDNLVVDKGITISADGTNVAIALAGANHLTLNGVASGSFAIYDTAGGSTIDIASTGTAAASYLAMFLNAGTTLNNYGIVTSNTYGINSMGSVAVNNFGTIQSNEPNGAHAIAFNATGTHTVVNSGLIASLYGAGSHSISGQDGGVELITNTGTIHGDIFLDGGNDSIDTHLGTLQGTVDLGTGNDTAYGSAAADSILGGDNNDRLIGNNGYDTLVGGENDDTMDGGFGKDRLDGGNGVDAFRFSTALSPSNVDLVVGFSHADDRIQLDSTIFTALGGAVTNSEFHINASGHGAGTSVVRLILDDSTHTLWYDDDGNGAHAALQVCGFSGMVGTLAFDDFVI